MTETPTSADPTPVEPAGEPESTVEPTSEPTTAETETDDVAALRREAATRRRELRQVEAERDALREQVDRRDRADVERMAGENLASGGDLWVAGVELSALRGEDGALEPELVEQAVADVLAQRPHWRKLPRAASFDGGARMTPSPAPADPFGTALKNAGRSRV